MKKEVKLGCGCFGNGITYWDSNREEHGDYKKVAHISEEGNITWYDKKLPDNIRKIIEDDAVKQNAKHFETVRQDARYRVKGYEKDAWIYKRGNSYGFRFGRLTKEEMEKYNDNAEFVMVIFIHNGIIFESKSPYTNRWCDCKDTKGDDIVFFDDNECKCGCKKHHYHHTICGRIDQVG